MKVKLSPMLCTQVLLADVQGGEVDLHGHDADVAHGCRWWWTAALAIQWISLFQMYTKLEYNIASRVIVRYEHVEGAAKARGYT